MLKLHLIDLLSICYMELKPYCMAALASTVEGVTISSLSSTTVHSCAYKHGLRNQNHVPFKGDLSSLWQDLISAWDMDGDPKI